MAGIDYSCVKEPDYNPDRIKQSTEVTEKIKVIGANALSLWKNRVSLQEKLRKGKELSITYKKMKVIDLPLSITVDRLVGTFDLEKAIKEGIRAFKPGLLAEANRNILYIDEVNLLDDYIIDILLDVVAYGWNIVEREGISIKHPCRVILVGSMNPEEGELRPQILDRFGLVVNVEAPKDPEVRIEIVKRVEEFWQDPEGFYKKYEPQIKDLRDRIKKAREILSKVQISDDLLKILTETIIKLGIKTHRAEIVTVRTAKAIAALDGRVKVNLEDLKKAMELALPHRIKSKPFEKPPEIQLQQLLSEYDSKTEKRDNLEGKNFQKAENKLNYFSKPEKQVNKNQYPVGNLEQKFETKEIDLDLEKLRFEELKSGREIVSRGSKDIRKSIINYPHGYPISYTIPVKLRISDFLDIDFYTTLNNAALRCRKLPIEITFDDLRIKIRRVRIPKINIIVLDLSGSMAIEKRISIAKGIVSKIIQESYIRRNYVSLITFRGKQANVLIDLTRNYEQVINLLDELPTGGRTPLTHALYLAFNLAKKFRMKFRNVEIWCYLITDGKANIPFNIGSNIREELSIILNQYKEHDIKLIVYDTRPKITIDPSISYIDLFKEFGFPVYEV